MTPLQITMLLHIYVSCEPIAHVTAPSQSEAIEMFEKLEFVYRTPHEGCGFALLPRGRAYVSFLCQLPFPIASWGIAGPYQFSYIEETDNSQTSEAPR